MNKIKPMALVFLLTIASLAKITRPQMEGFIVGGALSNISDFSHSAFLNIECHTRGEASKFVCGSSILNQAVLLTAGHCLEDCNKYSKIVVHAGNENRKKGQVRAARSFIMHEKYDPTYIANDIALIRLTVNLVFGPGVKRATVMRNPPYEAPAEIAGWGLTDEIKKDKTKLLKHAPQRLWDRQSCIDKLKQIPEKAFCAQSDSARDYAAQGDSGSALMVEKHIQIGLVSYKNPKISRSLVIYTDIGAMYGWIKSRSKMLFCNTPQQKPLNQTF